MMTRQARSSAAIMGLNTHMILEAVPARLRYAVTCLRPSTGHHATMPGPWGHSSGTLPTPCPGGGDDKVQGNSVDSNGDEGGEGPVVMPRLPVNYAAHTIDDNERRQHANGRRG